MQQIPIILCSTFHLSVLDNRYPITWTSKSNSVHMHSDPWHSNTQRKVHLWRHAKYTHLQTVICTWHTYTHPRWKEPFNMPFRGAGVRWKLGESIFSPFGWDYVFNISGFTRNSSLIILSCSPSRGNKKGGKGNTLKKHHTQLHVCTLTHPMCIQEHKIFKGLMPFGSNQYHHQPSVVTITVANIEAVPFNVFCLYSILR